MPVSRSFRPAWIALVLTLVASMLGATPAYAVTGGQPNNGWHPQVGLIYFEVGADAGICSGVLIAPDVMLTAAHCLYDLGSWGVAELVVSFDDVVDLNEERHFVSTEWEVHPDYNPAFWPYTYDIGLVFLTGGTQEWATGDLPDPYLLNDVIPARGSSKQEFTQVGYGQAGVITGGGPPIADYPLERRMATQRYHPGQNQGGGSMHGMDDYLIQLKANPSSQHGSGCGGDSGGPIFLGDDPTIVAIHTGGYSLGVLGSICGRISSVNHRIDTPEVLDWLWDSI